MTFTRIEICLETWTEHEPTGIQIFDGNTYVDSAYCDNAEEFIEYLDTIADDIKANQPDVVVHIKLDDIDSSTVLDCVMEIKDHLDEIRKR